MRLRAVFLGLALAALTALILLWIAGRPTTYDVRGRIAGFGDGGGTVFVAHEEIPGFMAAMTMPFRARDSDALAGLVQGEAIGFTLHVRRGETWISDVRVLPDSVSLRLATPPPSTESSALAVGEAAPDLTFVDQDGETRRLGEFRGRPLVLTFIYTRCPLPDYCPQLSRQFQALAIRLEQSDTTDARLLSLTLDPAYDTPEVLSAYGARYVESFDRWLFGTGDRAQMDAWTGAFGVYAQPGATEAELDHNLVTALLDAEGRLVERWRGSDWDPEAVWTALGEVQGD